MSSAGNSQARHRKLDRVRLPGLEQRKPAHLSGGQQQRSSSGAGVNRPAVLLLDEPLGALDQKLRKKQLELKRLQQGQHHFVMSPTIRKKH